MNAAREKVSAEGECRVCLIGGPEKLDAAHVWDRGQGGAGFDDPDAIVPLCSAFKGGIGCHDLYDAHRLELWPLLTPEEKARAASLAGSEARAKRRASGTGLIREEASQWDA